MGICETGTAAVLWCSNGCFGDTSTLVMQGEISFARFLYHITFNALKYNLQTYGRKTKYLTLSNLMVEGSVDHGLGSTVEGLTVRQQLERKANKKTYKFLYKNKSFSDGVIISL